jgi:hypothetical protein
VLGLIDGAVTFYVTLAALVWFIAQEAQPTHRGTLALLGFFAGSAAACKYPALLFVGVPVVAGVFWQARHLEKHNILQRTGWVLIAMFAACGLWFVKNWYFTGNPTYPLFYSVFDGATRTAENAAQWKAAHQPHGFGPMALVDATRRLLGSSVWLSPMVWPLVACLFAAMISRRSVLTDSQRTAAWAMACNTAFVFGCWWAFTHRIDRFWLPAVPALVLLAGMSVAILRDSLARYTAATLLVIGGAWCWLAIASPLVGDNRFFAPIAVLRSSTDRVKPGILELNQLGGPTLAIGEAAVFDFTSPVLYNTTFDPSWLERYGVQLPLDEQSLAGFDRLVVEHDLRHVYVDWNEIARYRSPGNYGFDPRVTPELFQALVAAGRLEELPANHANRRERAGATIFETRRRGYAES